MGRAGMSQCVAVTLALVRAAVRRVKGLGEGCGSGVPRCEAECGGRAGCYDRGLQCVVRVGYNKRDADDPDASGGEGRGTRDVQVHGRSDDGLRAPHRMCACAPGFRVRCAGVVRVFCAGAAATAFPETKPTAPVLSLGQYWTVGAGALLDGKVLLVAELE